MKRVSVYSKVKHVCPNCIKKSNHTAKDSSQFMSCVVKGPREIKEIVLEITTKNRNWHYLDGKPVQGLGRAIKYFRAKRWDYINKRNWRLVCPECYSKGEVIGMKISSFKNFVCEQCNNVIKR